jgi:nucleoredoxin
MRFPITCLLLASILPLGVFAGVEKWTAPNGTPMQAECLGRKGDYVVFKKTDGSRVLFPFDKLSASDQARIEGLDFPKPNNTVVVAPAAEDDPTELSKIGRAVNGKLVTLNGRAFKGLPADELAGTRLYAVYFSASWCGPCRGFTPDLVAAYPKIKAAHPEFEVIFVSADRDEDSMRHYMIDAAMPWTALRYKEAQTNAALNRYQGNGIPNLVFIDGDGRIISSSYEGGRYVGPRKVLRDIQKHFKM